MTPATADWNVLTLDAIAPVPDDDPFEWRPVRHALDVRAFGVNAFTAAAGRQLIDEHDEADSDHEELYVVIAGRARFEVDGRSVDAAAGSLVHVRDPRLRRVAHSEEDGTTVLAIGAPAGSFEPSEWEARYLRDRGDALRG